MRRRVSVTAGLVLFCLAISWLSVSLAADRSSESVEGLRSRAPGVWALTNATLVISPEQTVPSATLLIRDGKIEAAGADAVVPPDATAIDMSGRTIYAGFIDAYSEHTVNSEGLARSARYWNNQVTPQLLAADHAQDLRGDADPLRKQGIVARLVAPADGVIRGRSAVLATGTGAVNQQLLATDVAQHMELTVSRRGRSGYPGSPMGAVALARQALYDAQWYRAAWQAVRAEPGLPLPERNDALQALQPVIEGAMPVIIETSNELFLLRAEKFAAEFGLQLIVRGSGREYRRLQDVVATRRPILLPVAFPAPPDVSTAELAEETTLESMLHWDLAPENPARLEAAGVRFAFTTDRLTATSDFLKSIRTAVKRGLTPAGALRALTVTPAELFGISGQLGTLQKGRLASLVITDGDLFHERTRILETWVGGERFRHQPEPARTAAGQYVVQLQPHAEHPQQLYVELQQEQQRLSGRISRSPLPAGKPAAEKSPATPAADTGGNKDTPADKDASAEKEAAATAAAAAQTETTQAAQPATAEPAEKQPAADKPADDKPAKPSAEIVTLANVSLSDTALSATFPGDAWQQAGTVRLTLVLSEPGSSGGDQPVGFGSLIWPDGVRVAATVRRLPSAATAEAQSTAASQPTTPAGGAAADKDKDGGAAAQIAGEHAAVPGTPDSRTSATTQAATAQASFPVNFPLGAFGRSSVPEQPRLQAFIHATLWTCGPQGVIEDGTLLIGDGRILAVGRDIPLPEGTVVTDVRGMHISPGMIDCHSHAATDGGVNEGTQAITCEVRIGDFIDCDDITIYRQLAGGVTAANVLHGSANPIGGQNQVIKLRWGMNGEQLKFAEAPPGVKFALGENVKQSNRVLDGPGRYPQTRPGVEQIYRDAFQAARDYAARMDSWQTSRRGLPPRRDLELDALREIIEGRRWIHCHSYRQDEILALIRILDEYKITIGTFQHILEGYKVADAMARHGAMASAFSDWWAYKVEVQDAIPYAGALMHNAGVVVSFNSDDGELARHLNQEAAKAVKYGGVSREEALKFVTLNPARQLRIDQWVGSLEVGKHADFVVWNGDPLSNFSRCEQTWIDGRAFFHRQEDEQLQTQLWTMRNTLIQKILASGQKPRTAGERDRDRDPAALWPRFDEYCHHLHQTERVRLLEEQQQAAED